MFELEIKQIIAEQLGIEIERIDDEADIMDDLDADSLDVVELTMCFEEHFNIEVSDEEILKNRTVRSVIDYIIEKTTNK